MKNIYIIVALSAMMWACSKPQGGSDKRAQLDSLKKAQASLAETIKKLEAELDTTGGKGNERTIPVRIEKLTAQTFEHFLEVYGSVEAENNVMVTTEIPGNIIKINVKNGQRVRKGEVLAVLNSDIMNSSMKELETQLELATTLYEKQKSLWDQKIGTEMQYLEAKTRKEGLEKSINTLKTQQGKAYIKSPIDGVVEDFVLKLGEMASPGFPVARVINLNNVYIDSDVSETMVGKIKTGTNVKVIINGMEKELDGKITAVGEYINPANRTFKIRVTLPNNEDMLKPNLVTTLKIKDFSKENSISVPSNTVQTDPKGEFVYVVDTTTKLAQKIYVKTGITYKGYTLITEGLSSDMNLVTMGHRSLSNNEKVEIL